MNERLAVGVVTATHGVAGELKVKSLSGHVDHLLRLREALFRDARGERVVRFASVRPQSAGVIVKIEGVDSPEKARGFVGSEIWVPRSEAAPLGDGEYYAADLCRCRLWSGGKEIGEIRSIVEGGATPLLEVVDGGGRTILIPFIGRFIGDVDLERGRIELVEEGILR